METENSFLEPRRSGENVCWQERELPHTQRTSTQEESHLGDRAGDTWGSHHSNPRSCSVHGRGQERGRYCPCRAAATSAEAGGGGACVGCAGWQGFQGRRLLLPTFSSGNGKGF